MKLEILNGPTETTWSKEGDSPLSFPWDIELGDKQARFFLEEGNWWIEGYDTPHGTYCLNREQRVEGKKQIEHGDLLKASETWMMVSHID